MNIRGVVLVAVGVTFAGCNGNAYKGLLIYEGQASSGPAGFDIWVVALDEGLAIGAPVNLTQSVGDDRDADWNQATKMIAFASDRAGNFDIYTMNADGTNPRQITTGTTMDRFPSWEPNADHLAYASDEGGDFDIFRVEDTGSRKTLLTRNNCLDSDPAWSPDGTRIAYVTNCDNGQNLEIHVMAANGTADTRVTTRTARDDFNPTWSSDSARIAFESVPIGGSAHVNTEIMIMNADGSGLQPLASTGPAGDLVTPAWSPSGNLIAVGKIDTSGDYNLYIVDSADGGIWNVFDQPLTQWSPAWGDPN